MAGGYHRAFDRALAHGAECLQIFTRSGRQWAAKPLDPAAVQLFREAQDRAGLPVIVHDSYLINLGSEPGEVRRKSLAAFRDELVRCRTLGVPWLVAHPGSHPDEARGLSLIAEGLAEGMDAVPGVGVLLEITAGQGHTLGHRFEHLAWLLGALDPDRIGVCLDTCHLQAAGYDLATDAGYDATFRAFERLVGWKRLHALHLNDARKGLGSRVDRHANIGRGTLGLATFQRLLRDPRFGDLPAVLETPPAHLPDDLATLRRLRDEDAAKPLKTRRKPSASTSLAGSRRIRQSNASVVHGRRARVRGAGGSRRPGPRSRGPT